MINITLNGESHQIDQKLDIDELIDLFALPRDRVAIEVNENVIRRADWSSTVVNDGDTFEVVHFVGGG